MSIEIQRTISIYDLFQTLKVDSYCKIIWENNNFYFLSLIFFFEKNYDDIKAHYEPKTQDYDHYFKHAQTKACILISYLIFMTRIKLTRRFVNVWY